MQVLNFGVTPLKNFSFSPENLELIVLGPTLDDSDGFRVQLRLTQFADAGSIVETSILSFPKKDIDAVFTGYDFASGQPVVSIEALSRLLALFNLKLKN